MSAPGGGFHAATDADSEGEEGRFFLWTPDEIRAALDPEHAAAVIAYYGVTPEGNLRGRNVLHVAGGKPGPLVDEARPRLYAARRRRVPPRTDTKIIAAWNGLAIAAFARAGAALGEPTYVERARTTARFVLDRMRHDGRLLRTDAGGAAFLDDYAFVAAGLVDLYEATFDPAWLREALALHDVLARDFWDAEHGGFFQTSAGDEVALARRKPDDDGALPSGNAVAAQNLLRLAELTGDDRLRERADATLRAMQGAAPALLAALDFRTDRAKEIVIVRPAGAPPDEPLLALVRKTYVPNRVLTVVTEGDDLERQRALIPLLAEKKALGGAPTAYVCEQKVCALPTSDPAMLAQQLAKVEPLP